MKQSAMTEDSAESATGRAAVQIDALGVLMRRWWLCLLAPVLLAIATFFALALAPRTYRAEATVASVAIDLGGGNIGMTSLPAKGLTPFFENADVIEGVIAELGLNEAPYRYGPDMFRRRVLHVSAGRNTNTVTIFAELPTPDLARDVANAVARAGAEKYAKEMAVEYATMLTKLKKGASKAADNLKTAEKALAAFEATAGIELLRDRIAMRRRLLLEWESRLENALTDAAVVRGQIAVRRKELKEGELAGTFQSVIAQKANWKQAVAELMKIEDKLLESGLEPRIDKLQAEIALTTELRLSHVRRTETLDIDLGAIRGKIARLAQSLKETPPTVALKRKLVDVPALQQVLSRLSGKEVEKLMDMSLTFAVLNPTHSAIETDVSASRAEESRLLAETAGLTRAIRECDARLPALRRELHQARQALRPLGHSRTLAQGKATASRGAINEAQGVLKAVYLPAARSIVEGQTRLASLNAEAAELGNKTDEAEGWLKANREKLATQDRTYRQLIFERDRARELAGAATSSLRQIESVPVWPLQQLTTIPASAPAGAHSPRRSRIAFLVLVVSFLLAWGVGLRMDKKGRAG